jgi:hypothetical protein
MGRYTLPIALRTRRRDHDRLRARDRARADLLLRDAQARRRAQRGAGDRGGDQGGADRAALGERVGVIISGGNIDLDRLPEIRAIAGGRNSRIVAPFRFTGAASRPSARPRYLPPHTQREGLLRMHTAPPIPRRRSLGRRSSPRPARQRRGPTGSARLDPPCLKADRRGADGRRDPRPAQAVRASRRPGRPSPNADGRRSSSQSLIADGPVVLIFYRGGWCPYCVTQLKAFEERAYRRSRPPAGASSR